MLVQILLFPHIMGIDTRTITTELKTHSPEIVQMKKKRCEKKG